MGHYKYKRINIMSTSLSTIKNFEDDDIMEMDPETEVEEEELDDDGMKVDPDEDDDDGEEEGNEEF